MADVTVDPFEERAFGPTISPTPISDSSESDPFAARAFGLSAVPSVTPTAVPPPGVEPAGSSAETMGSVFSKMKGTAYDFGKDITAGAAGDILGAGVSSALLASRAVNPLAGTAITLGANYAGNLAMRRAMHGEWQPIEALVDVGIGALGSVKRVVDIFKSGVAAGTARVSASEALRLKGRIAKDLDVAIERLHSGSGAIPSKLRPSYNRGEVFSFNTTTGKLEKVRVDPPRLAPDTLSTIGAMAAANEGTLRTYSLDLAKKLDDVSARLPTPAASKRYSLKAPESDLFVEDDFAQAIVDLGVIKRQLSSMESDDPAISIVREAVESALGKIGSQGTFSFQESLNAITEANRAMKPLFNAAGDVKPGQATLLEAYVKMKQSFYDGMSRRASHVAKTAKSAGVDFPTEIDGWPTIFSDINNRMSVDIAIRDASEKAANISNLRTQDLEAGRVSKAREASVTKPEITGPWRKSAAELLTEESRSLANQGLGELAARQEAAGKFLTAIEKGSAPAVIPPSPLSMAVAAGNAGGTRRNLFERPLRAIASESVGPKQAKAEDIGLPPGFVEGTDMRAEELNFGPSSILQSLQAPTSPDMMGMDTGVPPEMIPPGMGPAPSSIMGSAGAATPLETEPTEPLPRTTEEFFSLDAKSMPIELLSDPELQTQLLDAQNGSAEDRRQALWAAMQKFPDRFSPAPSGPLKGYKSLVDDKLMDKAEEDKYREDMLEAFSKLEDDRDRYIKKAKYLTALNSDGTILEAREPIARSVPKSLPKYSPENTAPEGKLKTRKEDIASTFRANVKAEKKVAYNY